jgi:hypothetical protein
MRFLLGALVFFGLSTSHALLVGPLKIKGTVKSFDKDEVVLEQTNNIIKVPRSAFGKKNLVSGKKVTVALTTANWEKTQIIKKKK